MHQGDVLVGNEVAYCDECGLTSKGRIYRMWAEDDYYWKCPVCGEEIPCQPPMDVIEEAADG